MAMQASRTAKKCFPESRCSRARFFLPVPTSSLTCQFLTFFFPKEMAAALIHDDKTEEDKDSYGAERKQIRMAFGLFDKDNKKLVDKL